MTHFAPHHSTFETDIGTDVSADPDELGRLIGPIMAGARARGVADAFELMGICAILIDGAGRVLHAGGRAERALLPLVRIVGSHLIGVDARINAVIQEVIESGLKAGDGRPMRSVELCDSEGCSRLNMRAMRFPDDGVPGVQLLRAVIVVSERHASGL